MRDGVTEYLSCCFQRPLGEIAGAALLYGLGHSFDLGRFDLRNRPCSQRWQDVSVQSSPRGIYMLKTLSLLPVAQPKLSDGSKGIGTSSQLCRLLDLSFCHRVQAHGQKSACLCQPFPSYAKRDFGIGSETHELF